MRYDAFIIWGNGVYHRDDIIKMIDDDINFKVLNVVDIDNIPNIENFVKDVYKCDTVPWSHLIAKSKYLMSAPNKVTFILTENINPDAKQVGGGAFRHIQCMKVTELKVKIRNRFNPPFPDKNHQILPLNKGVSHEHVIHGTDYQSQVDYLLQYLKLPNLDHYRKFSNKVDVRYILSGLPKYTIIKKWDDFPNYMGYNDIDILCENKKECLDFIVNKSKHYKNKGWKIEVKNASHTHVDFIPPNSDRLDFRFDLISNLNNCYNKIKVSNDFKVDILNERVLSDGVFIPKIEHDLALRYMEYKEHIQQRPDKIKHLNYCKKYNINYNTILKKYTNL